MARFDMECDHRPLDAARFRHILPTPEAALRIQTVGREGPPRFRKLLEAFGDLTGLPFLLGKMRDQFVLGISAFYHDSAACL